jgi:S-adenosylmethionine decarboxylase
MSKMGQECLLNVYGCKFELLDNAEFIIHVLTKAAKECGATVLNVASHKFDPQGVTAILLLSESHITAHTYPEEGKAAFNVFTCGTADPKIGAQWILQHLKPTHHTLITIER